jgi:Skp family chaperone for outer membrane proteins
MRKFILTLLVALVGTGAIAQKASVGYIFEDYIFENYVGVKKLNEEFQKKQETFQTEFNKIALEYQEANAKYQESMQNIASETSESLNTKLKKVQELRAAAENQQKEAEKQLQEFMGISIARVKGEIKVAAETVSKQKGLQYVLSRNKADTPMSPYRVVLYTKDSAVPNISDDVLKLLNAK